jgi:proteasome lid subunit RPN8/RPN11
VGRVAKLCQLEECWILVGRCRGPVWYGRRLRHQTGEPARVAFDAGWVLAREEKQHDVVGFYHTHPGMTASPSDRDVRTMRAWCSAFGKPLLCVIEGKDGVHGYRFPDHEAELLELPVVEVFPRGVVIAVDSV